MRNVYIYLCLLMLMSVKGFGQSQVKYVFNVELSSYTAAPVFVTNGNFITYNGSNAMENSFFSKYSILKFYQTYPDSKVAKTLNMFTFETYSEALMTDLLVEFPSKYLRIENLTGRDFQLIYYPNDYGNTSPVANLGGNINLKSHDYVNAPKAWDFFPVGNIGNVNVGISDGRIDNTDADLSAKVTYVGTFQPTGPMACDGNNFVGHGTSVSAIAAAQGNNGHGMTGICPDCPIINVDVLSMFNGLLQAANAGAQVINMSWITGYQYNDTSYSSGFVQSEQDVIDEIYNMGVVLVAGAGNFNSFGTGVNAPDYQLYCYPASYNHVISVSGVNHWSAKITDIISHESFGDVSWYNVDHISYNGSYDPLTGIYAPYHNGHTTNSRVDICAPSFNTPAYSYFLLNCPDLEPNWHHPEPYLLGGTSSAAPFVTGTVALMRSLNSCLNPDEIEDILQLTSKNLEHNPYNDWYIGRSGSGKLETGDAVEFVSETRTASGNAIIDGQDFWRFNFDLQHIMGKLTISNQTFRDQNTSTFVAKGGVKVTDSHFKPGDGGFLHLSGNDNMVLCGSTAKTAGNKGKGNDGVKISDETIPAFKTSLFPNPATSTTTIVNGAGIKSITIFSLDGKVMLMQELKGSETSFQLDVSKYAAGVYMVNLITSANDTSTVKLIKE